MRFIDLLSLLICHLLILHPLLFAFFVKSSILLYVQRLLFHDFYSLVRSLVRIHLLLYSLEKHFSQFCFCIYCQVLLYTEDSFKKWLVFISKASGDREDFQRFTGIMALYLDHCCLVHCGSPVPEQNKPKYCSKQCPLEKGSILNEIQSFAKPRDKAGKTKFALGSENTYSFHGKNDM